MSTRDAYVEKMKASLDQWNADLTKLEAKAAEAEADAKLRYNKQIDTLRQQRDEAIDKVREVELASDAAWKDMQRGFESAWESMNQAFRDALGRFR